MWFFLSGLVLLGAILGLFWLKDRLESPTLHRMAYHEMTARLTVVAVVLIFVGLLLAGSDMLRMLGLAID